MRTNIITVVLIIACAVAFVSPVQAQKKTELGIKGSFGYADLTRDVTGTKSILGFGGGGLLRFSLSPQISIQTEALFVQKGAKQDDSEGDAEELKLTYFEVPVLVVYQFPSKGTIRPSLFVGPAISMLLSAEIGSEDVTDTYESTDFGIALGASIDFGTGSNGRIFLDGRYTTSVSNIVKDSGDNKVGNGFLSLSVGYIFPLGK